MSSNNTFIFLCYWCKGLLIYPNISIDGKSITEFSHFIFYHLLVLLFFILKVRGFLSDSEKYLTVSIIISINVVISWSYFWGKGNPWVQSSRFTLSYRCIVLDYGTERMVWLGYVAFPMQTTWWKPLGSKVWGYIW